MSFLSGPPQQGHAAGAGYTMRSRGKCSAWSLKVRGWLPQNEKFEAALFDTTGLLPRSAPAGRLVQKRERAGVALTADITFRS